MGDKGTKRETIKSKIPKGSVSSAANMAAPVSNETVLAAIDALRVSIEGRLDAIDASFLALQNEHRASEKRMDAMDIAITEVDTRVTTHDHGDDVRGCCGLGDGAERGEHHA